MKKVMFLWTAAMLAGFSAAATPHQKHTPPAAVVNAFHQKFPQVTDVDWGKEKDGEWEAEFEQNHTDMSANFTADGKWIETETDIKFAELPMPVQTALKGKKVKEAAKIIRADGSTVFEAEVKHKDLLFDVNGKRLN